MRDRERESAKERWTEGFTGLEPANGDQLFCKVKLCLTRLLIFFTVFTPKVDGVAPQTRGINLQSHHFDGAKSCQTELEGVLPAPFYFIISLTPRVQ